MKMRSLEYFVALAESKSINEAAKKLYVAQPSLTKALQLLERELGVALFERTGTGIRLTEAGEKILPEDISFQQFVGIYKQALEEIRVNARIVEMIRSCVAK